MKLLLLTLVVLIITSVCLNLEFACAQEFDKEHLGVSFSPYVKLWEGDSTPPWNSYNIYDIKIMLKLIASKFKNIATYSMGVTNTSLNQAFDKGDANGLIPRAAAQLNSEAKTTLISIAQGVHQSSNSAVFRREIEAAFEAAEEANALHNGTVWAIILTNQYVTDPERGAEVLHLIRQHKEKARSLGLKLGTRTHTCEEVESAGDLKSVLESIAQVSDFIMCNIHPPDDVVKEGVDKSIEAIGQKFDRIATHFKVFNPSLEVILGDSGWPSRGKTFNGSPNNIQNLKAFWIGMNSWASNVKKRVYLFEAFDEPWKTDIRNLDPDSPSGRYGAESHYGWWKRLDNYNTRPNFYVEKVTVESSTNENEINPQNPHHKEVGGDHGSSESGPSNFLMNKSVWSYFMSFSLLLHIHFLINKY